MSQKAQAHRQEADGTASKGSIGPGRGAVKRRAFAAGLFAAVAVAACGTTPPPSVTPAPAPVSTPQTLSERAEVRFEGGPVLVAEVADAPREWAVGLMHRTTLGDDEGMLFLFDDRGSSAFWMRDTLIPLAIAFLRAGPDGRYEVVDVLEMAPCPSGHPSYPDDCPRYAPDAAYDAALEANTGWFAEHGIGKGATADITLLRPT